MSKSGKSTCEHPKAGPFASPCEGPMWESPRYYVTTGKSSYRCEKHAKWIMGANPAGPRYKAAV